MEKPDPKTPARNSNPKITENAPYPRKKMPDHVTNLMNAVDGSECQDTLLGFFKKLKSVVLASESTGEPGPKQSKPVRTYCCI